MLFEEKDIGVGVGIRMLLMPLLLCIFRASWPAPSVVESTPGLFMPQERARDRRVQGNEKFETLNRPLRTKQQNRIYTLNPHLITDQTEIAVGNTTVQDPIVTVIFKA